jgi:hypothetical protein
MLNLIQKDNILGKHVYFNIIFTQNLEFSYASTDFFMSALASDNDWGALVKVGSIVWWGVWLDLNA